MAGNEQAAQLPLVWLLRDVVWVVTSQPVLKKKVNTATANHRFIL
jgi:hypothetical protein